MNCETHKCPFSYNSETNSLTHRGRSRKHTFQKIPACLCAGGLINYSQIHHHFSRQSVRARTHADTHTCAHLSLKVHSTPAAGLSQCSFGIVSHTHSRTLKHCADIHGGHYPLPWLTGVCMCEYVCVCVRACVRACVCRSGSRPLLGIY